MSTSQRYELYAAWCQSIGICPAPREVWSRTIAKISEISGIKGYGENLVQSK